jgi:uridine phosphorylase
MGHHCLAVNAIVANRVKQEFSKDGKAAVEKLIQRFLQIFSEQL